MEHGFVDIINEVQKTGYKHVQSLEYNVKYFCMTFSYLRLIFNHPLEEKYVPHTFQFDLEYLLKNLQVKNQKQTLLGFCPQTI